jgi:hypothetical protein
VVDEEGTLVLDQWIGGLTTCASKPKPNTSLAR